MDYQFIDFAIDEGVGVVTTNRPKYRNAQSRKLLEELDHVFARCADNPDVRVVLLLGSGEHFSGGHDLGSPDERADREERPLQAGVRGRFDHSREQFVDKTMRWRNLPMPTIAAVQGYCIFAGWMVASSMDIIYAAKNAMFLGSNFQYFSMPWDMNHRQAKEILFESRLIDAEEARSLGLVNRVYDNDELISEALAYAKRVATNDPFQLRMMKLAVNQAQDAQGFTGHINAAHAMHMLSIEGESDPDYALKVPPGQRRPMVEKAFANYDRRKQE